MKVEIIKNDAYAPLAETIARIVRLQGGAGSAKSFETAQELLLKLIQNPKHRIFAFRKVGRTVKHSIFQTFIDIINDYGLTNAFRINKSDHTITYIRGGNFIACGGMDDREKVKSIKDPTIIWMEEATEFVQEDFKQLNLRLRKQGILNQIILSYNPITKQNWIYKAFDEEQNYPDHFFLKTTYKDNAFIPNEYRQELERLISIDANYHKVYALGEWGDIVKGLIYPDYEIVDGFPECKIVLIGGDFGFVDPTVVLRVGIDSSGLNMYVDELIYQSGLTDADLAARLEPIVSKNQVGYFDSAAPGSIRALNNAGFNLFRETKKGAGSIESGIKAVQQFKIHVTARSTNTIKELNRYKIAEDKQGEPLDKPIDAFNHAMDAMRYPIYTHFYKQPGQPKARATKIRRSRRELR